MFEVGPPFLDRRWRRSGLLLVTRAIVNPRRICSLHLISLSPVSSIDPRWLLPPMARRAETTSEPLSWSLAEPIPPSVGGLDKFGRVTQQCVTFSLLTIGACGTTTSAERVLGGSWCDTSCWKLALLFFSRLLHQVARLPCQDADDGGVGPSLNTW